MNTSSRHSSHTRPILHRSHYSDSTLTDTSQHSAILIDFDPSSLRQSAPMYSSTSAAVAGELHISRNMKQDLHDLKPATSFYQSCTKSCRSLRYRYRQFFAEFIGTFVMVVLINGISAEQTLDVGSDKSWLTTSFGNGLAVLVAICISGHVSGAHLNPAVTLAFCAFSGFPKSKVPMYIAAQISGAFSGAAVLYSMIRPAIDVFDKGDRQILGPLGTAGIFATYPPLYAGPFTAVASEVLGTALLLLLIMVTGHPNNMPFCSMQGVMIAAGLMVISLGLGYTSGFSLNPARDLGPRLFTCLMGWGPGVFSAANYYAFIPSFAPILGGLIGGGIYKTCIDPFDSPAL
ncbi:unnamed protein product [Absidia cylindrospora]